MFRVLKTDLARRLEMDVTERRVIDLDSRAFFLAICEG